MRIVHYVDLKNIGGVGRYFVDFIHYLSNNITHYTIAKSGFHLLIKQDILSTSKQTYSLRHIGNIKIPKFAQMPKEKYVISKMKTISPDLWLFWDKYPTATTYKNILSYKIMYYEHGAAWFDRNLDKRNMSFLERVNSIVCVSNAAKRMLQLKWGIKNKNIVVCLNAIRPSCKPNNVSIKTLNKNKKDNVINLGIAGRQKSFKGFFLVIHAVKELKKRRIPCKLHIAGVGPKLDDLQILVKSLSLEDDVSFFGLITDMKEFYSQIDLFICPSIREPFGLVNIEAMAHGCPVVVAGVDGMPEILEGTNAGIVIRPTLEIERYPEFGGSLDLLNKIESVYDPYTDSIIKPKILEPTHIADAVEELWNNPDRFKEMSANAVKAVDERYNYNTYLNNMYTIINNVISN